MSKDKISLRTGFRAKRDAVRPAERHAASEALVLQLYTQDWFTQKQAFALYRAMPSEIDTQPLITALWQQQKDCYLPRITTEDTLVFAHYTADTVLIPNRFGIAEPLTSASLCTLQNLDVIFMPLVAFDEEGHRLGMGAGFYDKTLAHLREQKERPLLVGLAYELQKTSHIPHDVWDIDLDIVVTEETVYT